MTWQRVAAGGGGTVAGLCVASGKVFAATTAGVFESTDAGQRWRLLGDGQTLAFAEAVAAPDGVLFACAAGGLHRSEDGGGRWQQVLVGGRMLAVAAAAEGVVIAGSESDGVLRSDDGGRSWRGANAGLLDLTVLALALSPLFHRDGVAFVGTPSGVYRSRNGARSWRSVDTGVQDPAVQCLAVSPHFDDDRLVLAGTEADGLLTSNDGGSTWQQALGGSVSALAFAAHGSIAAATDSGLFVSSDKGASWQRSGAGPGAVLGLAYVERVLLAGLEHHGVSRSADDGATWRAATTGLDADVPTALAITADGTVYVATLEAGVRRSPDAGATWLDSNAGLDGATVLGLATLDQTVYAATSDGVYTSQGGPWRTADDASQPASFVASGSGLVVVAFADGAVRASDGAGTSWRSLGASFTGAVTSLAVAPGGTTFVGTRQVSGEFVLWRQSERWLVVTDAAARVMPLAIGPSYAIDGQIVAAVGNCVFTPLRGTQEVRAHERRPMWRRTELKDVMAITALAATDRTLLAATNAGVFVSRDGGETFQPWNEGLTPPGVVALGLAADQGVYASALGGAVWRRTMPGSR